MTAPWESAALARLLSPLGWIFRCAASARRGLHRRGLVGGRRLDPPVPVISVGNLTVGGTGKSPFVREVIELLPDRLRPPLVAARGYGARILRDGESLNDEGWELRRYFPGIDVVQSPDRFSAIRSRPKNFSPGSIILDDGFQHLRMARDMDIVLIDARSMMKPRRCLPAGPWREGLSALADADAVVVTRADRVEAADLEAVMTRLTRFAGACPILTAIHRPRRLVDEDGEALPPSALEGRRVLLVSAIADPDAFAATVSALGARIAHRIDLPDHRIPGVDVHRRIAGVIGRGEAEFVLTTGKDAVKLAAVSVPVRVLEVGIDLGDDRDRLRRLLEDL